MNQQDTLQELDEIAEALHRVLGDEFKALKKLDADAVERTAACKEILTEELSALRNRLPDHPAVRATIGRLQDVSHANQALLIHARSCIRGALELTSGATIESPSYARSTGNLSAPALRVDIRG